MMPFSPPPLAQLSLSPPLSSSLFDFLLSEEINSFFSPFDEMEEFLCGLCEDKDAFSKKFCDSSIVKWD